MLTETDFELLNAEIDGVLSPAERAALSRRLLESPELRHVRDELRNACAELDRIAHVEPPAGLREKILAALPAAASSEPHARRGFAFSPRTLRFAAAVVGGVLVSAVAFQASRGIVGPTEEQVVGTIAQTAPVAHAAAGGQLRVDVPQAAGTLAFTPVARGLVVEYTPDAGPGGSAADPADVTVHVARGDSDVRLEPVAATQQSGVQSVTLPGELSPGESLQLRVQVAGVPVFEGEWRAPAEN